MYRTYIIVTSLLLAGCYQYDVDSFDKHCERIKLIEEGRDQLDEHAPFWAILPSISFHPDAIRDDFVAVINKTHLEKVQNHIDRMAWREGLQFHLVNLSSLLVVEPEAIIDSWRSNIQKAKEHALKDPADKCIFGTVADYFDVIKIHSVETDALGSKRTVKITEIPTDR